MAKQYFIPKTQDPYINWHDTLTKGVTATTPGATADDVTMLAADNAKLHAKKDAVIPADNASTVAHQELNGAIATSKSNAAKLAQRIKKSIGYTDALGAKLNLVGPEDCTDMNQAQPTLQVNAKLGGMVAVSFDKQDAEGVHLYEMREGETVFTYLASETHSPYYDTRPLLVPGKTEQRYYKAIYFIGKAEVGQPSAIVTAIARP
jgi:hypothetical protein